MTNTQPTELELELTYLAKELPVEITSVAPKELLDIYIPVDRNIHSKLRLRKKGDTYEITKKVQPHASDASMQHEFTIPIEDYEFDTLAAASDKRVEKYRYAVVIEGHNAEVDVFRGELAGLVLIDFEFDSEEEKATFTPPACCLADVTQEEFAAGGNLAGKTYADIADDLARYNYVKIA